MKIGSLSLGFIFAALMSVGCGSPSAGSCSVTSNGAVVQCIDFHDGYTSDQVQQACSGQQSESYSSSACASENRLGRCDLVFSAGGITLKQTLSYYPPTTAVDAMTDCNSSSRNQAGFTSTFSAN